jgi:hypothetical protein
VVTHDLRVTFTDDRLNAQIQLRRVHNDLDRGRSIAASEQAQKRMQYRQELVRKPPNYDLEN